MEDKKTGSFYTPEALVSYMVKYVFDKNDDIDIVLEPSIGDGRFIDALYEKTKHIDGVEINQEKIQSLKKTKRNNTTLICADFVEYAIESKKKYDLIIGNPPYISKKNIVDTDIEKCYQLAEIFNLDKSVLQNLWVSFVLGSIKLLNENGVIFLVLPFEFLQVEYAKKLRLFLEKKFNIIEIITFETRVFKDIEQDVCLVYLKDNPKIQPGITYTTLNNVDDLTITWKSEIKRNKPLEKWSNAILTDEQIELLKRISRNCTSIADLGFTSPGIVTGANSFFIINDKEVKELKAEKYVSPIISKSADIKSQILFDDEQVKILKDLNKKMWLLSLKKAKENDFSKELKNYLKQGEDKEINQRYKCKQRDRWFDVPIIKQGDIIFFKRYHKIPKMIVNDSNIYTTDMTYNIRLNECYDKYSVAFCFYNSLTLALCEYNGRFYGGGVAELVPSEFKALKIPYRRVNRHSINKLNRLLIQKTPITKIVDYVDGIVLNFLDSETINELKIIRNKYLKRRLNFK